MSPRELNDPVTTEGQSYQKVNVENYDAIESALEDDNTTGGKATNFFQKKSGKVAIAAIAISALVASLWKHYGAACPDKDPIQELKQFAGVENVKNGAVAADDARCSDIGNSILRDHDGNAIDAAVATMFCLGVVNPAASGIGGGAVSPLLCPICEIFNHTIYSNYHSLISSLYDTVFTLPHGRKPRQCEC